MALPAANLLPTVISARFTAHPGRLGRLRIDYSCAGLWVSPQLHPQAFTQSRVELLEGSIYAPPPKPPVDGLPRREVARQKPPSAAALEDIEDGVEDLAAAVGFRSSSLVGRRNMELQALPFGVGEIGRVAPFHAQERTSSTYSSRFSKQFLSTIQGLLLLQASLTYSVGSPVNKPARVRPYQDMAPPYALYLFRLAGAIYPAS